MKDSWIALADRDGLNLLVRETPHVVPFLLRRAQRQNAVCFWVVLESRQALFIEHLMQMGANLDALHWLEHLAIDFGSIPSPKQTYPTWLLESVTVPHDCDTEWY